ncbi:hypothetical protein M413DRAFT_23267 [Hebeloma cylindrosporum]|uniref:Uncharacterized protein n=1 Tax=Hebeloma cylindrosporum TaxID=76867 RepID=A0A0C2YAS6_HEBCY|nr:hypothetical protein M413DRAFT_23267 [Hebeloma cylindrosporum h7]
MSTENKHALSSSGTDIGSGPLMPLDILLLIVDETKLDNDIKSLRALSIVSHDLLRPCKKHLFSQFTVHFAPLVWQEANLCYGSKCLPDPTAFLLENPEILGYMRYLKLDPISSPVNSIGWEISTPRFAALFSRIEHLQNVE